MEWFRGGKYESEGNYIFGEGEPIMSDAEFDQLKEELREEGSSVAVSTEPKCYIETGICTVTFQQDKFRNNLLYLPMITVFGLLWEGIGYETLGGVLNPLVLAILGAPVIGTASKAITDNFIFPNNFVAYGPCPTCEAENGFTLVIFWALRDLGSRVISNATAVRLKSLL